MAFVTISHSAGVRHPPRLEQACLSAKRAVAAVHRDRCRGSSFSDEHPSTGSPEMKKDSVAAEFGDFLDDSVGNLNSVVRSPKNILTMRKSILSESGLDYSSRFFFPLFLVEVGIANSDPSTQSLTQLCWNWSGANDIP